MQKALRVLAELNTVEIACIACARIATRDFHSSSNRAVPYIQLLETPMQMYTVNSDIYTYERISTCMQSYWKTTNVSNMCCTSVKCRFVLLLPVIICVRIYHLQALVQHCK